MSEFALNIVPPVSITDDILIVTGGATTVPENEYSVWSSATTYALAARIINTTTHKVYESLQAANTNRNPLTEPLWWIDVSPTNRWAVFDASNSTQTKQANSIQYTLKPLIAVNSIAALNLTNATQITITMTSDAYGVVYTKTIDIIPTPAITGWWEWFFGVRRTLTQNIQLDLPSYPDASITFLLIGGEELAIGVLLIGQQRRFGFGINYGARVGIQDYSRKETNDFGDTVVVKRAFAKRATFDLLLSRSEVDALQNTLADIRATPCLFVGSDQYETTTLFGFYKSFDISITYPEYSVCEFQIEGIT